MLERVSKVAGAELGAREYLDDFWRRADGLTGSLWKLERLQHFREPDEPSWQAMMAGDWGRALALIEEKRAASKRQVTVADGIENRRVRVVERPVTPYVQWEMHILRIWVETGAQDIRVLDASLVRHLESRTVLPELVILGKQVMYEVRYDAAGDHCGARRIEDTAAVSACHREIAELYAKGEDLLSYFDREIAPLPPPRPEG